jgi:hypothetical protein
MDSFPYPGILVQERLTYFSVLRESRDVIKMGAFRMWDQGAGAGCPVQDRFFRKWGLRVFTSAIAESRE